MLKWMMILQLKREWKEIFSEEHMNIGEFLNVCSLVIMEHCGGASGPIWGAAFRAAHKGEIIITLPYIDAGTGNNISTLLQTVGRNGSFRSALHKRYNYVARTEFINL